MNKMTQAWVKPNVEGRIAAHVRAWDQLKRVGVLRVVDELPFITISREFGCEALPLAQRLATVLNQRHQPAVQWVAYDREVLERCATELHLRQEIVESITERRRSEMTELFDSLLNRRVDESLVFRKLAEVLRALAMHGHAVLVGRGGYLLTADLPKGLHLRLVAPLAWRIHRVAQVQRLTEDEAARVVDQFQTERLRFVQTFFSRQAAETHRFGMVLDNSQFNIDQMVEIIAAAVTARFVHAQHAA